MPQFLRLFCFALSLYREGAQNERDIKITNTHGKVPFNECSFDTIDTEEKAYWLGFMYADGYISSKNNQIGLSLAVKDIEHL